MLTHEIDVERFKSWPKVEELNRLADAIKHADGWSCERLKELRPDLFCHPDLDTGEFPNVRRVFRALQWVPSRTFGDPLPAGMF